MHKLRNELMTTKQYFFGCGIILSVAYLMFYYRNVGLHDGFVYIQAGQDIANGKNPYSEGITRSGTVSSLLMYFIYFLIPKSIAAQIFQVMNFGFVAWFLWVLKGKKWDIEDYLLAVLVSIWLSPVRELLAINQVNAYLVGLLGTAIWIHSKPLASKPFAKYASIGLCFALAIDLKPHLLIIVLLAWAVLERSIAPIAWTVAIFILLHIAIDLYIGEITELTWFSRVVDVKNTAGTAELGDSVTIWPIFLKLFPNGSELVPHLSLVLFLSVTLVAIFYAIKGNSSYAFLIALAAPGFYIYFHFYDMIPLALIFVVYLVRSTTSFQYITLLCLMLIPKEFTSLKNLGLVVVIATIVWLHSNDEDRSIKKLYLGFFGYGIICYLNSYVFGEPRLTQSIFVTEILMFVLWSSLRLCQRESRQLLELN